MCGNRLCASFHSQISRLSCQYCSSCWPNAPTGTANNAYSRNTFTSSNCGSFTCETNQFNASFAHLLPVAASAFSLWTHIDYDEKTNTRLKKYLKCTYALSLVMPKNSKICNGVFSGLEKFCWGGFFRAGGNGIFLMRNFCLANNKKLIQMIFDEALWFGEMNSIENPFVLNLRKFFASMLQTGD